MLCIGQNYRIQVFWRYSDSDGLSFVSVVDSLLNKVQLSALRKCRRLFWTRFLGGADHNKTLPRVCSAWSEMAADWKKKCDSQWQLGAHGVPMPDSLDWKSVFEKKPFERNLLQNPSPYGNDVTPYWLASATFALYHLIKSLLELCCNCIKQHNYVEIEQRRSRICL